MPRWNKRKAKIAFTGEKAWGQEHMYVYMDRYAHTCTVRFVTLLSEGMR